MMFYKNPVKKDGDFADPYVLKFNGRYYLYCTNQDIRCWSSNNLVDWMPEGPAIDPETFPGLVPFAPEVVYWNGSFYMYTSPSGLGHYVLVSQRPTGPFTKLTHNVGHSIDGSVLIDDDGKWYFYWADDGGILGCEMPSPTEFGEPVRTGAYMHGWTEGPYVVKAGGKYYMTYTGNHYLSKGYRIHLAVGDSPLSGYADDAANPIVVHTQGEGVGLGHSCTVLGPDLQTRYIVYHNINPDRTRDLNLDAIALESGRMRVLGPTRYPQPAPAVPDYCAWLDSLQGAAGWAVKEGAWHQAGEFFEAIQAPFYCLCGKRLPDAGAVEFNLAGDCGAGYGIVIGNETELYRIAFDPLHKYVNLLDAQENELMCTQLPPVYAHGALHCVRLAYGGQGCMMYIDGRRQAALPLRIQQGSRFGYFSKAAGLRIGYTAFCRSAEHGLCNPVPCAVPLNAPGRGEIRLNLEKPAEYALCIHGAAHLGDVYAAVDGKDVPDAPLLYETGGEAAIVLGLPAGIHTVGLRLEPPAQGSATVTVFEMAPCRRAEAEVTCFGPYDKFVIGGDGLFQYAAEAEFLTAARDECALAGLLFRACELSEGGEGEDKELGIDFFIGYCVSLGEGKIVLSKHRYDQTTLAQKRVACDLSIPHRLRASAVGGRLSVFLDGAKEPALEYTDSDPIYYGGAGLRVRGCMLDTGRISIIPTDPPGQAL